MKKLVIGITGASGAAYARKLIDLATLQGVDVALIVSNSARISARYENVVLGFSKHPNVALYKNDDIAAPTASGSHKTLGMIIVPCSMKTLSNVANGNSGTLITRAADVHLKERRKCILAVRETPLTSIHIENMAKVTAAGGIIAPLSPGFYHNPNTIDDMVTHVAGRLLDLVGVETNIERWG